MTPPEDGLNGGGLKFPLDAHRTYLHEAPPTPAPAMPAPNSPTKAMSVKEVRQAIKARMTRAASIFSQSAQDGVAAQMSKTFGWVNKIVL